MPDAPSLSASRGLRTAHMALVGLGLALAWQWVPLVAGDAVLHLSIAERTASGDWFAFQGSHPEASTSSPLWSLIGAALWALGGASAALFGLKALCLLAWLSIGLLVRQIALQLGASRPAAASAALLVTVLPSLAFNGLLGTESALFAATILLGLWRLTADRPIQAAAALGLAAALRPEGAIALLVLGLAWLRARRPALPLALGAVAVAALCAAPSWLVHLQATGELVPGSALSRTAMARRDPTSLALGPLWLYLRPLYVLALYAPLPVLALLGARSTSAWPARAALLTAAAGVLLYTFAVGGAQASRYLIWVLALLGPLFALGLDALAERRRLFLTAGAWLLVALTLDASMRVRYMTDTQLSVSDLTPAPERRADATRNHLLDACSLGCCADLDQPALALREVQLRFFLDDRVRVVGLDGVIENRPGHRPTFDDRGCPDLDAILADPQVVAILERPASGLNLAPCVVSTTATARIDAAWAKARDPDGPRPVPGWRWVGDAGVQKLVRDCTDLPPGRAHGRPSSEAAHPSSADP